MMAKSNEQKAKEVFRKLFDPTLVDEDIEGVKKQIEWLENSKTTIISTCPDPKLRQKMEKSCDKTIKQLQKHILSFEKTKADKVKYREQFLKMLDDMRKG
jgi:hypothetical protein